ncbi:unnamed protein product [Angiostrongylus costaricensis]|uniref:Thioredoxin domain-containing protein n=1 Tax=Angiostrongylus costaricensis TaxID=334426 RepID=A0A158PJV8_ANGCS|nr:unnamed protein product [Angiostrongylus costaricensis]
MYHAFDFTRHRWRCLNAYLALTMPHGGLPTYRASAAILPDRPTSIIHCVRVSGRNGAVLMAKINVDQAGELAMDYGVTAVPTVMSFKNGERIGMFTGVISDDEIDDFLDDAVNH